MTAPRKTLESPDGLAGQSLGEARCYATFELANQETVTPCHLQRGHEGDHEGWCLGSKAHWPHGFISEYELHRALNAEIVRTKIEMIELEKDLSHNDKALRPARGNEKDDQ